jgi:hypothetical protein
MTVRPSGAYRPVKEEQPSPDEWDKIVNRIGCYSDFGDEWLRFSALKWFVDGGFRISWTREPHPDPAIGYGKSLMPSEYLNKVVAIANRYNWRVAIHCVGDAAIDQVLDAYEYANWEKPIVRGRWILIHSCLMRPDQMERAKKLGVIVTLQDFMWIRAASVEKDLGKKRADRVSPARSVIDKMGIESCLTWYGLLCQPHESFHLHVCFYNQKRPQGGGLWGGSGNIAGGSPASIHKFSCFLHIRGECERVDRARKLADFAVISDDIPARRRL